MVEQTIESCTAFGAGGRKVGPLSSLQASRKVFNAIKAELLASESVFNVHNSYARGQEYVVPSSPGTSAWVSMQSRPGVKEGSHQQLAFFKPSVCNNILKCMIFKTLP